MEDEVKKTQKAETVTEEMVQVRETMEDVKKKTRDGEESRDGREETADRER